MDWVARLVGPFLEQEIEHAIVLLDPEGRVVGWLGAAEHILGFSAQEMLGQPLDVVFTPIDRERGQPAFELRAARTAGRSEDDRWHQRRDGTHIWITGTVTAIRGEDGELLGYVKLMRDRTDLRGQLDTLENRAESLAAKQRQLGATMDMLGHEIRNPLHPLEMATRLIERHPAGAALAQPLQIIDRQLAVLRRLAEDLVDVTRLGAGRIELQRVRFVLQDLLADTVAGFQDRARTRQVTLHCLMPDAAIYITADPDRLEQVVLNLVDNALKYSRPGGSVTVRAVEEGREAAIHVEDDGLGISPELLPRIFEMFTQGSRDIPATRTGLGIGLALAREVVELHGGFIEARSAGVDKGSIFTIRLPLGS